MRSGVPFRARGDDQIAAGLRRNYLLVEMGGVLEPKLKLGDESNVVWRALLKDETLPTVETLSAKRLTDAAKRLRTYVGEIVSEAHDPKEALS